MRKFGLVLLAIASGLNQMQFPHVLLAASVAGVTVIEFFACSVVAVLTSVWSYREDSRQRALRTA
ncbi:MAG: hypothetical protein WKF94_13060 [Solirubrobacteraceae bacterium]